MGVRINSQDNFDSYYSSLKSAMNNAARDIRDDLQGVARGAAPHNSGILDQTGIVGSISSSNTRITVKVKASAVNRGFDYALHMHDGSYHLGDQSRAKAGGRSGISGKSFSVGKGYLKRPATENEAAYRKHFERAIRSVRT